jgi:hypothetical protein
MRHTWERRIKTDRHGGRGKLSCSLVSANPSSDEYLTDVKFVKSFAFISGKTWFFFRHKLEGCI